MKLFTTKSLIPGLRKKYQEPHTVVGEDGTKVVYLPKKPGACAVAFTIFFWIAVAMVVISAF